MSKKNSINRIYALLDYVNLYMPYPELINTKLLKIAKCIKKEKRSLYKDIHTLQIAYTDLEAKNNSFEDKLPFEDYIKEINETFDFVKVHKCMIATNWNWYFGKDENGFDKMGIPSLETLKNEVYRLLKEAYDSECQISTGGFTAFWEDSKLELIFTIQ